METKTVLHAAVGAPFVAYHKVEEQFTSLKGKMDEKTSEYGKSAEKALEEWAVEGEKVMTRISEGKVVEEISSVVDLDQAKEQVTKLRDQLEDMLDTWRHSFRPEKADESKAEEVADVTAEAEEEAEAQAGEAVTETEEVVEEVKADAEEAE